MHGNTKLKKKIKHQISCILLVSVSTLFTFILMQQDNSFKAFYKTKDSYVVAWRSLLQRWQTNCKSRVLSMRGSDLKVKNAEETGSTLKTIGACERKSSVHGKTSTLRMGGDVATAIVTCR